MENHQDDILKKFLQDTFSDYEPEPSDASWENIFSAIQPNKPTFWGKAKPWIASVVVIFTGALLWYGSEKIEETNTDITLNIRQTAKIVTTPNTTQSDDSQTKKTQLEDNQTKNSTQSDDSQTKRTQLENNQTNNITQSDDSHTKRTQLENNQTKNTTQSDDSQTKKTQLKSNQTNNTTQSDDSQTAKTHQLLNKQTNSSDYHLTNRKAANKISPQVSPTLAIYTNKKNQKNHHESIKSVPTIAYSSNENKYSKNIIVKSDAPIEGGENHPIVEKQSDETVVLRDNFTASTSGQIETLNNDKTIGIPSTSQIYTDKEINKNQRESIESVSPIVNPNGKVQMQENTVIEQVRYVRPLESLRNKDFTLAKIALNSPIITPVITPSREVKPVRQHTYISMSITPIQTYRILTVNNHAIQNVQTNNLFDAERNGWQLDLGITKPMAKLWNFRANISYLRMRQWSEYQVSTDGLILRNNNNGNIQSTPSLELEVVEQTITESKNLHMVGLKMDVQKFFKITPKNRYFISTGTQVMYENSQQQSNIFLNVSAGFQHIISKTTFLTLEPTASYSLNNFNDSQSLLQANGYNLGLKMGVSFMVK